MRQASRKGRDPGTLHVGPRPFQALPEGAQWPLGASRMVNTRAAAGLAWSLCVLAVALLGIGLVLWNTGKLAEALQEHQKALAIRQRLADANPAVSTTTTTMTWRCLDGEDLCRSRLR